MAIEKERLSSEGFVPQWVWLEHIARYEFGARFVKEKVVVDCACGAGIGSETFARAGAKSVVAFDVSEKDIESARRKNILRHLTFQQSSGLELPIASSSVDVYISLETIEHVAEDLAFLREAHRVLQPAGIFICSTPNRAVTDPGKSISDKPWNQFHAREYSQDEFIDLLNPFFSHVELYGQNPKRIRLVRALERLGKVLPMHGVVRINQVMKLPNLVFDEMKNHVVQDMRAGYTYEYLVAICRTKAPAQ